MPTFNSFRGRILALEEGARLYHGKARRNFMYLVVRFSVFAHKFRDEEQKKFSALNVRLRFGVHLCVLSWKEILLTLRRGAQAVFGGHRSRNVHQWHRVCYFLLGHNPRLARHKL